MKREPLTETELVQSLKSEAEASCQYYDTTLARDQELALKYYDAQLFGDEVEGLSTIVSPDVAEAVDHMTPSVLKLFVSGDRVVEFSAKEEGAEDITDEATEAVHQIFMQTQDGYRVLHDWLKSGLIEKIGIVKSAVVDEDSVSEERFLATEDQLGMIEGDADIADNGDGTFSVTVREEKTRRYFYDYTVPTEEFRFSPRTRHEDDADYLAHVCRKTRSDLVKMGFDVDTVYDLPTGEDELLTDQRSYARDEYDQRWLEQREASMQEVELWEEYIRIDADGDGIAELLKVFRVGDKLLSADMVDEHPFTVFCPFPRPHRLVGDSLADKVMDIQRVRSTILRQLMNGMYLTNMPRYWLPQESEREGGVTIKDLLTVIPGAPVRGRGVTPPQPLNSGFDIGKSLGLLEFWTGEKESRTGITRMNQGLDADTLNKTATGTALMQQAGQQIEEFIARNFAECVGRMFWRKYRLIKDVGEAFTVKVGGSYKLVDPTRWPDEPDIVIKTGLGTGRKDQRIAQRMQLLEIQRAGFDLGMVDKEKLFNGAAGIVRDMGIGQPDDFFLDPAQQQEPDQSQPDPMMVKVEAEAQIQQAKLQGEQQLASARLDAAREEMQIKQQLAQKQAEFEAQLARDKHDTEIILARERMAMEGQLARERAALDAGVKAEISRNRPGGDLSE